MAFSLREPEEEEKGGAGVSLPLVHHHSTVFSRLTTQSATSLSSSHSRVVVCVCVGVVISTWASGAATTFTAAGTKIYHLPSPPRSLRVCSLLKENVFGRCRHAKRRSNRILRVSSFVIHQLNASTRLATWISQFVIFKLPITSQRGTNILTSIYNQQKDDDVCHAALRDWNFIFSRPPFFVVVVLLFELLITEEEVLFHLLRLYSSGNFASSSFLSSRRAWLDRFLLAYSSPFVCLFIVIVALFTPKRIAKNQFKWKIFRERQF